MLAAGSQRQEPPAPADRRAHPRTPLRQGALLELEGGRAAVTLLDLSEGGAAVQGQGIAAAAGQAVGLMLDTALIAATVVALEAEDGVLRLAFQPLSPAGAAAVGRLLALGRDAASPR